MIVADVCITTGGMLDGSISHVVGFDSVDAAKAEYDRVADLLLKHAERKNDLPKTIEVVGATSSVTVELSIVRSVGFADYAKTNAERDGLADAFPNLYRKSPAA